MFKKMKNKLKEWRDSNQEKPPTITMRDCNGALIKARDIIFLRVNFLSNSKIFTVVMTEEFGLIPLDAAQRGEYIYNNKLPENAAEWGKGKGIFAKLPNQFEVLN